jgi:fermentation-respiration switch protein FrsA (DUF1100 family)
VAHATYVPGTNRVSYDNEGCALAAHLFLPGDFDAGALYPAIVLVRPATGVKEQTAGLYAERLASKGFVTLAFDARGFGDSKGRRLVEDPLRIVQDTYHAISFLERLPFVDPRHIFSAGVCMGASYAPYEAARDARVKAVASITPYLTFHVDYPALYGGGLIARAVVASTDLTARAAATLGLNLYWYAVPTSDLLAAWPFTLEIARGMRAYYPEGQPGHRPSWKNRINFASMRAMVDYNPFNITHAFRTPFYMAYGTRGYAPRELQRFFDEVQTPKQDKMLRVLDATHFEMYWKPQFVEPIVDDVSAFFRRFID